MNETTDHTQRTLTDNSPDNSQPSTDQSTKTQQQSLPSQLTRHSLSDTIEDWCTSLEADSEGYAYYHVVLEEYNDLTGTERCLIRDVVVSPPPNTDSTRMPRSYGGGKLTANSAMNDIVDWYVGKLASPHHEDVRPIPIENIRVFLPERVQSHLQSQNISVDPVLKSLRSLPEHYPSKGYRQVLNHQQQLKKRSDQDVGLGARESRVDDTLRAKLGYSTKFGTNTPSADPHYNQFTLSELKQARDTLSEVLEFVEAEQKATRSVIRDYEQRWKQSVLTSEFPDIL